MEKIRNSIKFIAIEKELIEPNKKPFSDAEFEVLWANMFGGVK